MHIIYDNVWTHFSTENNEIVDIFNINKLPIKLQMVNALQAFLTDELKNLYATHLINLEYTLGAYKTIIVYFSPLNKFIKYNNLLATSDKMISFMF